MRKRRSALLSHRYLNTSIPTLLAVLAAGCSDDATAPAVDATPDAALATSDTAPLDTATSDTSTDLFGNNPPPTPTPAVTSSAPDYDGTQVNTPIQACSDAVGGGGAPLIDDFEDGDEAIINDDGRGATWYFYDDMTQGERDDAVDVDPLGERGQVLNVTGSGFTDWGSGFGAGMHWNTGQCTYDASTYDGVEFWIRGTGTTRVNLQNLSVRPVDLGGECPTDAACFDSHGVNLTLNDAWTLVHLPFSAFEQAGWGTPVGPLRTDAIYLLEFQFGTVKPYSVWLDDVTFFRDVVATDAGSTDVSASTSTTEEGSPFTGPTTDSTTSSDIGSTPTTDTSNDSDTTTLDASLETTTLVEERSSDATATHESPSSLDAGATIDASVTQ